MKWNHTILSFCHWLIPLSKICSRFIHVVVCVRIFFLIKDEIFHCMYIPHFVYPSISGHLGYFSLFAIVNNAVMNIHAKLSI